MSLPPKIDRTYLADLLFTHLNREEISLRTVRVALSALHVALIENDVTGMDEARASQIEVSNECLRVQEARQEVCRAIGNALHIPPEDISLSLLAIEFGSPWGEKIQSHQQRLQKIANEIDLLQKRNATLIGYCRTYVQQLLASLTATSPPIVRYGRQGEQHESTRQPMLLAQG